VEHIKGHSKGEVYTINGYIKKKTETSQIDSLLMHLRFIEKQEQRKSQINRWREITKIRNKSNEIETKQTILRINETKVGSLEQLTR
jgi:hypothetical protein